MLSYGAGLALCTVLALSEVRRAAKVGLPRGRQRGQPGGGTAADGCRSALPALSPQAARGEAAGCSANLTERRVAARSAWLRWSAAAHACNFNLTGRSEDGRPAGCRPASAGNGSYGCTVRDLEAGTWYHLRIEPLADGEAANVTLQTGKPLPKASPALWKGGLAGGEPVLLLLSPSSFPPAQCFQKERPVASFPLIQTYGLRSFSGDRIVVVFKMQAMT